MRATSWRAPLLTGMTFFSACGSPAEDAAANRFDALFVEATRVALRNQPSDPIAEIASVSRRPGGGYLVVDAVSHRVLVFDGAGELERVLGRQGDGPGELDTPTAAVELPDGRVFVTQRANPRMTVFRPDDDPLILEVPGLYGRWLQELGDHLIAGIGSRGDRFVVMSQAGDSLASFGPLAPEVSEIPFWIYYAMEHATVLGDRIAINTSFYPGVRVFDSSGALVDSIDAAPPSWVQAGPPPVDRARTPDAQQAVRQWSREFTVVAGLAGLRTGQLVVQYGRFDPSSQDIYHIQPSLLDVFSPDGRKVAEEVPLPHRIVSGGAALLVLVGQPPDPWTFAEYEWRTPDAR